MSEHVDPREAFAAGLLDGMPPEPSSESLARVRARTDAKAGRSTSHRAVARTWRTATWVLAAVAAVVVAASVLAPRFETAAFARERAADALLLETSGRVLHAVMRYTETGWSEKGGSDARFDLDQRWSFWVDPGSKRSREEFVNLGDGSLDGLSVRIGDRSMVFQNNVRYLTGGRQQLIDQDLSDQPFATAMGTMIDYMRARIADGSARATGTKTIDGEEYWVVEHTPQPGESLVVTMRKSDYRLKTWARESAFENENGKNTQSERIVFETMEQLAPETLPPDFFSFDEVVAAAKPGTPIDRR